MPFYGLKGRTKKTELDSNQVYHRPCHKKRGPIRVEGFGFLTALALSGPFSLLALALLRIDTLLISA